MTQIASFDLGALAANRQPAPSQGASKARGDFMSAFQQAASEARRQERAQDAERAEDRRAERDQDTATTQEAEEAPRAEQARAERPERPEPSEQPKAEEAPPTEQPQPKAETAEQPAQETEATAPAAPTGEAEQVAEEAALDAQAVLALQLATGGQVAQPVVVTTTTAANVEAEAAAETQTVTQSATAAAQTAQAAGEAEQAAIEQAAQRTAAKAEVPAETKAQIQASAAQAQATQPAEAKAQAQAPAFLTEAARNLGPISVQTAQVPLKLEGATTSVAAQATVQELPTEATNLSIQLLNLQSQEAAKGSTTPVTLLAGAEGTEMPSQPVTVLTDDEAEAALAAADPGETPSVTLPNGDRTATETAKAALAKEVPAPARAEEVLPQISKHLEALKANQASAIKLQLYPEHLGKMEIKVVSHQGVLSAQLTADSHSVKAMLETQVAALQRSFAEMGLKVDKVEVTLSSASVGQDPYGGGATQQGEQQAFGRQQQPSSSAFQGSGYQQWLGDEPADEAVYAQLDSNAAINYVA